MSGANSGRENGPPESATTGDLSGAAVLALVREHRRPAPYGAVDWALLEQRIIASGRDELATRQQSALAVAAPSLVQPGRRFGSSHGIARASSGAETTWRPAGRRWWEVTAGWARPAIAAALVVCAVSTAVVLGTPAVSVAESSDSGAAAWLQSLSGNGSAAFADRPAGSVIDPALSTANRDSLFHEVVEQ
jgi:hypothetical protein